MLLDDVPQLRRAHDDVPRLQQVEAVVVELSRERLRALSGFVEERVARDLMEEHEDDRGDEDGRDRDEDQPLPDVDEGPSHPLITSLFRC